MLQNPFDSLPFELIEVILEIAYSQENASWKNLANVCGLWRAALQKHRYTRLPIASPRKFDVDVRLTKRLEFLEWSELNKLPINIADYVKNIICTDSARPKDLVRLLKFVSPGFFTLQSLFINIRLMTMDKVNLLSSMIQSVEKLSIENQWNHTHLTSLSRFPSKIHPPYQVWSKFFSHFCSNTKEITFNSIPFLTEDDLSRINTPLVQLSIHACEQITTFGMSRLITFSKFSLKKLTLRINLSITEDVLLYVSECENLTHFIYISEITYVINTRLINY